MAIKTGGNGDDTLNEARGAEIVVSGKGADTVDACSGHDTDPTGQGNSHD